MQDFWKVAFSFGLPWEPDQRGEESDDSVLEIEEWFEEEGSLGLGAWEIY